MIELMVTVNPGQSAWAHITQEAGMIMNKGCWSSVSFITFASPTHSSNHAIRFHKGTQDPAIGASWTSPLDGPISIPYSLLIATIVLFVTLIGHL